jgi:hypothetical protein
VILPDTTSAPEPPRYREPAIAARGADPWAVDYGRTDIIETNEPSMVGYTAPFAGTPAEPAGNAPLTPSIEAADPILEYIVEEPETDEAESTDEDEVELRLDDQLETTSAAHLPVDAGDPVIEISARDFQSERASSAAASSRHEIAAAVPAAKPQRSSRSAATSVLRLMPLAIWARAEVDKNPKRAATLEEEVERSVNDELRDLMSRLAVPPNIVGVSYARGCRIRRVRVTGDKPGGNGDAPGPVILSKKALDQQRSQSVNR